MEITSTGSLALYRKLQTAQDTFPDEKLLAKLNSATHLGWQYDYGYRQTDGDCAVVFFFFLHPNRYIHAGTVLVSCYSHVIATKQRRTM